MSFYAKLRLVGRTHRACSLQHFLHVIRSAQVDSIELKTASLSSRTQQVLAIDISEMDTKLVTATEGNKLFGLVCKNTSGMA